VLVWDGGSTQLPQHNPVLSLGDNAVPETFHQCHISGLVKFCSSQVRPPSGSPAKLICFRTRSVTSTDSRILHPLQWKDATTSGETDLVWNFAYGANVNRSVSKDLAHVFNLPSASFRLFHCMIRRCSVEGCLHLALNKKILVIVKNMNR
jgi:hypothetical protein